MKLEENERVDLVKLQNLWNDLTKKYGELHYQKKLVDADLVSVDAALDDLDAQRTTAVSALQTKYGTGQINLVTGEFIPSTPST